MNGSREDEMTTDTIQKIQACLTVCRNGDEKKIIDVELLLKRHKAESVISLLKRLLKEKQKTLVTLVDTDESKFEIDEVIGTMFRLHLAIRRLEREKEEVKETCPS
jgi:transposase